MAVEQVARWPWNAWPDERGLGGRMVWNPHKGWRDLLTRMGIDVTVPEQRCQVSYRDAVDDVRMHVYISCVLW